MTYPHVPPSSPKSLPLPSSWLLPQPTPGKILFNIKQRQQEHLFAWQATRGSATKCSRRLQLQLPGGRQAEAGQAGEWGQSIFSIRKLSWLRNYLEKNHPKKNYLEETLCHLCYDTWHISHLYWRCILQLYLTSLSKDLSCFAVWRRQRGGWGNLQLPHTRGWGGGGVLHCQWERIFPLGEIGINYNHVPTPPTRMGTSCHYDMTNIHLIW